MNTAKALAPATYFPEPTPFVGGMKEYALTSQEVWRLEDRTQALKLDWNEGTVVHPIVIEAVTRFLATYGAVNWYPDVTCREVVERLSTLLGMEPGNLLMFPGSDVALDAVVRTFIMPGDDALLLTPTYDNFRIYVESCGARVHGIKLTNPLGFDVAEFIEKCQEASVNPKVLYLVNPNNPIGYAIANEELELILQAFPRSLVIIDEAYAEFAGTTAIPLVAAYPNVFVARSFSKAFALAGMRLGYLVSQARNLAHVNKVRNPKNISMLAQVAASALLENFQLVQRYVDEVVAARTWLVEQMRDRGAVIHDSHANFVLMRVPEPAKLLERLAERRVYCRDRSYMEGLSGMVRITVGTRAQMEQVVKALDEIPTTLWRFEK